MIHLLPGKHIRLNETAIGLGAVVLSQLATDSKTLDELWDAIRQLRQQRKSIPEKIGLEDIVLTIEFLFGLGLVQLTEDGELQKCD